VANLPLELAPKRLQIFQEILRVLPASVRDR